MCTRKLNDLVKVGLMIVLVATLVCATTPVAAQSLPATPLSPMAGWNDCGGKHPDWVLCRWTHNNPPEWLITLLMFRYPDMNYTEVIRAATEYQYLLTQGFKPTVAWNLVIGR
jgi:hypothetical protein